MITLFIILLLMVILVQSMAHIIATLVFMVVPCFIFILVGYTLYKKKDDKKIIEYINNLTYKENIKHLNLDEKHRLARIVDTYLNDYATLKRTWRDDLLWAGIGYSFGTMGFDNAMRVGVGYTVLRKYIKPAMRNAIEKT